jgi:hypothetical protein
MIGVDMLRSRLALLLVGLLPMLVAGRCAHGGDAVDDPVATEGDLEAMPAGDASADAVAPGEAPTGDAGVPIPELDPELEATFEPAPTPDAPPELPGAPAGVDPSQDFGVPAGVPPIGDPGLPDPEGDLSPPDMGVDAEAP